MVALELSAQQLPPSAIELLKNYLKLADAQVSVGSNQENFLSGLVQDVRYVRALQGLRLVARHKLLHVMQALSAWRAAAAEDVRARAGSSDMNTRGQAFTRRGIIELMYLEPMCQLLEELTPVLQPIGALPAPPFVSPQGYTPEHARVCEALTGDCFKWLVGLDDLLPMDLPSVKAHILSTVAHTLGALSRVALPLVSNPFLKALMERINPRKDTPLGKLHPEVVRNQLIRLCHGMRHLTLIVVTKENLHQAGDFLAAAHPLAHTASIKKSQVHHALAEMLTQMLWPLVKQDYPHAFEWLDLAQWHPLIQKMRGEIWSWMQKHDKHIKVGWPMVTALVCLLDDEQYSQQRDSTAEFLLKQLKNREWRTLAVKCLVLLMTSLLVRYGKGQRMPKHEMHKWLDKVWKPDNARDAPCLWALARKGGLSVTEIQDVVTQLGVLAPDYAAKILQADLLQQLDVPDCTLAALRALHVLLSTPPPGSATLLIGVLPMSEGGAWGAAMEGTRSQLSTAAPGAPAGPAAASMLELLQAGYHPIVLLGIGHLSAKLASSLSKLWAHWHLVCGTISAYVNPDSNQKDKGTAMGQLIWLMRLSPLTRPELWPNNHPRPLDYLPGYLNHPDSLMRTTASEALHGLLRGSPHLRNTLLMAVALYAGSLSEDSPQMLRDALSELRKLVDAWTALLVSRSLGDVLERSSPDASVLDLHQLEGCVWASGLCSHEEYVRREALQVLISLRQLHQTLVEAAPYEQQSLYPPLATAQSDITAMGHVSFMGISGRLSSTAAFGVGSAAGVGSAPSMTRAVARSKSESVMHMRQLSRSGPDAVEGLLGADPSHRGLADLVEPGVTYIMDIVEQSGSDLLRAAYWDWGEVSDLWAEHKEPPPELTLQALLCAPCRDVVSRPRLMRVLIEVAKAVAVVSPVAAAAAHYHLTTGRLVRLMARDPASGRFLLLLDTPDAGRRAEAWRYAAGTAAALPSSLRDKLASIMAQTGLVPLPPVIAVIQAVSMSGLPTLPLIGGAPVIPPGVPGHSRHVSNRGLPVGFAGPEVRVRDLLHCLVATCVPGAAPPSLQAASSLALGHTHPSHHETLFEEVALLVDECAGNRPARAKATLLGLILTSANEPGEYSAKGIATAGKTRADEARRIVAHIMRLLVFAIPPSELAVGATAQRLGQRIVEWLKDTFSLLKGATPGSDTLWDNLQVAYCLCSVLRRAAPQLAGKLSDIKMSGGGGVVVTIRKGLYDTVSGWSADAQYLGKDYQQAIRSGMQQALSRLKNHGNKSLAPTPPELEAVDALRGELSAWASALDHVARAALAALLAGPILDADARRPQGAVLQWVDRMLTSGGAAGTSAQGLPSISHGLDTVSGDRGQSISFIAPSRLSVGKSALLNLLHGSADMFVVCLDKAYDGDRTVASTYFQVVCEVYCTRADMVCPTHVLVSLVLYKMADCQTEVREDARHVLRVLSLRVWGTPTIATMLNSSTALLMGGAVSHGNGTTGSADKRVDENADSSADMAIDAGGTLQGWAPADDGLAYSTLQEQYQSFQAMLSQSLAREHPELSENLCEEMMTRALECADPAVKQPVLISLVPWIHNLKIVPQWKGTWCERLLKSMYYVTQRHGTALPSEIAALWVNLASPRDNVPPMLLFLLEMGMDAAQQEVRALEEYLGVAKVIVMYLARTHPQFTVDELQITLGELVKEGGGASRSSPSRVVPLEFAAVEGDVYWAGTSGFSHSGSGVLPGHGNINDTAQVSPRTSLDLLHSSRSADGLTVADKGGVGPHHRHSNTSSGSATPASSMHDTAHAITLRGALGVAGRVGTGGGEDAGSARLLPTSSATSQAGGQPEFSGFPSGPPPGTADDIAWASPSARPHRRSTAGGRALLSRPELALCLLSEVAFICDKEFRGCLPLLLHACFVLMDADEPLVYRHAAALLTALIHSLGCYLVEEGQEAGQAVDVAPVYRLVRQLQAQRGQRLWPYEDTTCHVPKPPSGSSLASLVDATLDALYWDDELQEQWASRALAWALQCRNRHLLSRSFQVFRALRPPLDTDLLATLLLCLHSCMDTRPPHPTSTGTAASGVAASGDGSSRLVASASGEQTGISVWSGSAESWAGAEAAMEVLGTLQALVESLEPASRLLLYPQVFWLALALLQSPLVAVYVGGLRLLASYMRQLRLHQAKVQNVLLAAAPGISGHIMLHSSSASHLRKSENGVADVGSEEPDSWALGVPLLQLPPPDSAPLPSSRVHHTSLAVQQLLLKGLSASQTLPSTLNALADLAGVLEVQGAALHGPAVLQDTTNGGNYAATYTQDLKGAQSLGAANTFGSGGGGGPYDSLRKHRLMRLDAHQALLGPSHSQLFISCIALLQHALTIHCTLSHPARTQPEARIALGHALVSLGKASASLGLLPLGNALHAAASVWAGPELPEDARGHTLVSGGTVHLPPSPLWQGELPGSLETVFRGGQGQGQAVSSGRGVAGSGVLTRGSFGSVATSGGGGLVPQGVSSSGGQASGNGGRPGTSLSSTLSYPGASTGPVPPGSRADHQATAAAVCAALASALLPRYGLLLLHHCMDTLSQPGTDGVHLAAMHILQATFSQLKARQPAGMDGEVQGGWLGPCARAAIINTALLSPLQEKTQGPLARPALAALSAILEHMADQGVGVAPPRAPEAHNPLCEGQALACFCAGASEHNQASCRSLLLRSTSGCLILVVRGTWRRVSTGAYSATKGHLGPIGD